MRYLIIITALVIIYFSLAKIYAEVFAVTSDTKVKLDINQVETPVDGQTSVEIHNQGEGSYSKVIINGQVYEVKGTGDIVEQNSSDKNSETPVVPSEKIERDIESTLTPTITSAQDEGNQQYLKKESSLFFQIKFFFSSFIKKIRSLF